MNNIEKVLKEFDEKFPFGIIDWKIGKENDGDVVVTDKMKEMKSFLRTALENYGKEIVGALKKADNISLPNDMWDEWEDGYHEANTVAQKVVEDISGIKK